MKLSRKVEDNIKRNVITKFLQQKNEQQFIESFRKLFSKDNCELTHYCGECLCAIPTMTHTNKKLYSDAKFDELLVCIVCKHQTQYKKINPGKFWMVFILLLFMLAMIVGSIIWLL